MDLRTKQRVMGKMRVTALITAAYKESAQKSKPSSCWRYCGWVMFGYAACIVMLCLGITVIILGGVFTKTGLYILGGVFVVGSVVLFVIVCAPGESCGRKRRVAGESSANLKEEAIEIEQETPKVVHKTPLPHAGKRLSFRSAFNHAIQQETGSRRLSTDSKTLDRSWVKAVESQQAKSRMTKSTIEEEPEQLSKNQNQNKQESVSYSNQTVSFKDNANDDIKIEYETVESPRTDTDHLSDSKDAFKETTQVPNDRNDEGKL